MLGHLDLGSREESTNREYPFGKKFFWTNKSLKKFFRLTEKVGRF